MNNRVSVIVPSYNHAGYIIDSLESVLSQTYRNFEVVILDDASSDNSVLIIKDFIEKHPGIDWKFLLHQENLGGVITINQLIEAASSEYIALINSDDTWLPEKLECQVEYLDSNPNAYAVFTQATFIDSKGRPINHFADFLPEIFLQENRSRGKWLRKLFMELNCLCHPSIMIRKSVYELVGLYDPRFRQLPDMQMWIRLLKLGSFNIIEEPLVKMRIHEANTSKIIRENTKRNINELMLILDEFLDGVPNDVFLDGFSDLFKYKEASTDDEMACEKAFLFFLHDSPLRSVFTHIGIEKLYHLLGKSSTREILNSNYAFGFHEFNALGGSVFFDEDLLAQAYPIGENSGLFLRYGLAVQKRFLERSIRKHPIIFKPLQRIWRMVKPLK